MKLPELEPISPKGKREQNNPLLTGREKDGILIKYEMRTRKQYHICNPFRDGAVGASPEAAWWEGICGAAGRKCPVGVAAVSGQKSAYHPDTNSGGTTD